MQANRSSLAVLSMLAAAALLAACEKKTTTVSDTAPNTTSTTTTTTTVAPTPAASDAMASTASTMNSAASSVGNAADRAGNAMSNAADKAGEAVGDAALTGKVKTALIADPDVKALKIDVDTKDKVVTLNGSADSQAHADKAVTIARGVEGVKSVENHLTVKP